MRVASEAARAPSDAPAAGGPPARAAPLPLLVVCREFTADPGRAYFSASAPASIHVAANRVGPPDLESVLLHELTLAVDGLVHGLDLAAAGPLACSELRAAWFGECRRVWPPALRRACARSHAAASVKLLFPDARVGAACVEAVAGWCLPGAAATGPGDVNPAAPGTAFAEALEGRSQP